jgi:exonuclease SbcC
MIIEELKLNPFGGVREGLYRFQPGLNVLLGPNEAGKSTLVNALFAVLFLPPDLRRNSEDWKNFMVRCLPHPGGDTARVSLRYQGADGERCTYSCSWGEIKEARLVLSSGAEINNPAGVRERLLGALCYGRGTYQAVLFARQDEMERTLERLSKDGEASRTVSGILRRAVIEAGGVSLEELEESIAQATKELLQNWDLERDGPKNNRGIDNPYERGVGRVLAAYYESENLRYRLRQTRDLEKRAGDLAGQLEETAREEAGTVERLKKMELLEKDIRRQIALKPQLETIEMRADTLRKVIIAWPKTAGRVGELAKNLEKGKEKLAALLKELGVAKEQQAARQKRELLQKARPLHNEIIEKEKELCGLLEVSKADLRDLKEWQKKAGELRAVVGAMKLRVRFAARKPLELKVTPGLEKPAVKKVEQEASFEGAGRLLLESADWSLEVQSGEGDVENLLREITGAEESLAGKLESLAVPDIAAAEAALGRRENLDRELAGLRARLEGLLGEISFSALEHEVSSLPLEKEMRDPQAIQDEITALSGSIAVDENTLLLERQKIDEWAAEYGSPEELAGQLGELQRKAGEITAELKNLAPLPEGYASADEFMAGLEKMRELKENLQASKSSLRLELAEVRNKLPEESSEELEEALSLSARRLARLKEEARALQVVAAEFQALKDELDSETFEPLARSFARYLGPVTGGRYTAAELDGVVPGSIVRVEGETLPVELLSTGTAGGVALALRLAVAEYLLEDAAGFMIMDDPLVHLDPERKARAAEVLREFACEKQLIITTYDPDTADLLGGNIMML